MDGCFSVVLHFNMHLGEHVANNVFPARSLVLNLSPSPFCGRRLGKPIGLGRRRSGASRPLGRLPRDRWEVAACILRRVGYGLGWFQILPHGSGCHASRLEEIEIHTDSLPRRRVPLAWIPEISQRSEVRGQRSVSKKLKQGTITEQRTFRGRRR